MHEFKADHRSYAPILSMFLNDLSYIHLHSSLCTGILRTQNVTSSQWLDSAGTAEVMGWNLVQA